MIIERLHNTLAALAGSNKASVDNIGTHDILGMPPAVFYVIGSLFLLIGVACFFLYPKARRNAEDYRKDQLIEYNKIKESKGQRAVKDYKQTGMFLPAWEKVKMFSPVFFGMVFCIIGISWLAGQTLFSW